MKLIICIVLCLLVGGISGGLTASSIPTWYLTINKPSWNPPNWIFGPVWTMLYVFMGIALARLWDSPSSAVKTTAIVLFGAQLVLNFMWSVIFFNWHTMGIAFAEIILLWGVLLTCIFTFAKIDNTSAWLFVPYISWVSFASILNFAVWQLNS
jgi:translocator protein